MKVKKCSRKCFIGIASQPRTCITIVKAGKCRRLRFEAGAHFTKDNTLSDKYFRES